MKIYANKQDKRAMNRIRKRNAELALLYGSDVQLNSELDNVKKPKLMQGNEHENDDASIPGTSEHVDLPAYARILGQQVKEKFADRELKRGFNVEPVIQLYKLQGRTLSEHEIAAFLHRMILGGNNCGKAGSDWIKFKGGKKPLQLVFIRINTDDQDMVNTLSGASFMEGYFKHWIKLKPSAANRTKFWQTISTVTRSKYEMLIQKIKINGDPLLRIDLSQRKAQMLMSLEQMATSKFPFPTDFFAEQACTGPKIRSTRKIYKQVTETSPIFILDCEMCHTSVQQLELTRISVVNENGETVMDELVKPHNKITNYITFKSGITEKILHNVFTRLKDIQHRLCTLLPPDGILCGHSIENDLRALQLSHPYCIDTSLLFNFSGRLHIRSGLKALSKIFLNEDIQDSNNGHCSLQDALATWKLLKLKIEKGLQFGNVALGWRFAEWAKENGLSITGTKLESISSIKSDDSRTEDDSTLDIKEAELKEEINTSDILLNDEVNVSETSENEDKVKEELKNEDCSNQCPLEDVVPNGSFNFEEALRIENGMQFSAPLTEFFHQLNTGGKYAKKMLIAMNDPNEFFSANDCCTLINFDQQKNSQMPQPSTKKETSSFLSAFENVSAQLINFDYAFLELNCPKGMSKQKLDEEFKLLTNGVCNNAFVLSMICTNGNHGKAILYERVHRKKYPVIILFFLLKFLPFPKILFFVGMYSPEKD